MLEFLASANAPKLAALGISCPDHFLRTKVKPMLLDLPASASAEASIARLKGLHEKHRSHYTAHYEKHSAYEGGSLLAVELGEHGIKVNGINPDGVLRGSGIFAAGWGANRTKTYGIDEQDLGKFCAQRTILKREVLPENAANAASVLTGPDLSHTTGLHIPVDAGVAAAFLR